MEETILTVNGKPFTILRNDYRGQWDFEHWGIRYWSKTPEFLEYLKTHSPSC